MKTNNNDDEFLQNVPVGVPADMETDFAYDPMSDLIRDIDVRTTVASLPNLEKNICLMLMEGKNVHYICRKLKISTQIFLHKYIPLIRNRFLEYGFEPNEINF